MGERVNTCGLGLRLSDLEVGKLFDGDELIIEMARDNMTTIRHDPIFEEEMIKEIRIYYYDIKTKDKKVIEIHNNGYGNIGPDDKFYDDYKQKLSRRGLWKVKKVA